MDTQTMNDVRDMVSDAFALVPDDETIDGFMVTGIANALVDRVVRFIDRGNDVRVVSVRVTDGNRNVAGHPIRPDTYQWWGVYYVRASVNVNGERVRWYAYAHHKPPRWRTGDTYARDRGRGRPMLMTPFWRE